MQSRRRDSQLAALVLKLGLLDEQSLSFLIHQSERHQRSLAQALTHLAQSGHLPAQAFQNLLAQWQQQNSPSVEQQIDKHLLQLLDQHKFLNKRRLRRPTGSPHERVGPRLIQSKACPATQVKAALRHIHSQRAFCSTCRSSVPRHAQLPPACPRCQRAWFVDPLL